MRGKVDMGIVLNLLKVKQIMVDKVVDEGVPLGSFKIQKFKYAPLSSSGFISFP